MNTTSIMIESRVKPMLIYIYIYIYIYICPNNDRKETNIHKVQKKGVCNHRPKKKKNPC